MVEREGPAREMQQNVEDSLALSAVAVAVPAALLVLGYRHRALARAARHRVWPPTAHPRPHPATGEHGAARHRTAELARPHHKS